MPRKATPRHPSPSATAQTLNPKPFAVCYSTNPFLCFHKLFLYALCFSKVDVLVHVCCKFTILNFSEFLPRVTSQSPSSCSTRTYTDTRRHTCVTDTVSGVSSTKLDSTELQTGHVLGRRLLRMCAVRRDARDSGPRPRPEEEEELLTTPAPPPRSID